ncbi:polysaccharide deacetylase family protein [Spirillospora sp. NPDC047279]|uniref:polysaccharide deacetylase family protein n=1 Tax=Spirillospora sp. NPDC047279 TaxID=3155478 RepID=UPI0033D2A233
MRHGARIRALAGAAALTAAMTACTATAGVGPADPPTAPAPSAAGPVPDPGDWARWGLKPLAPAPPPPADRPLKLARGTAPVIDRVPTRDRVVFVTIDDGKEKDPRFVQMMTDLRVPISMFLTDDSIKDDYAYFTALRDLGNHVQNHTMTHPVMPLYGQDVQQREICGQQRLLTARYGTRPTLFRPPFGRYGDSTQAAAIRCGARAIVMWRESMQIHDMQYDEPDRRLRPGDIILAHFRGPADLKGTTMTQMFANLLKRIRQQGFAVARLEDYIQLR